MLTKITGLMKTRSEQSPESLPNPLDPSWMTEILRNCGGPGSLEVSEIHPLPPLPGASSLTPLEILYTQGSPAGPARVILKRPPRMSVKMGSLNEVTFYQTAAPRMWLEMSDPPILRCYSALGAPEGEGYQLVMEDCSETHAGRPPSMLPPLLLESGWIVDALADLHAFWWDRKSLGREVGRLPAPDTVQVDMAQKALNYARLADFLGDRLAPSRRSMFDRLLSNLPDVQARRLAAGRNLTLIHDDPHAGNFLYPRNPAAHRLLVIDWKSWSIQPGAADLAHMMGVFWFPERRARLEQILLRRYFERLVEKGITGYAWEDLWLDYRLAICNLMFYPAWQWAAGLPDLIWWPHLERLAMAFEDLRCDEILGSF